MRHNHPIAHALATACGAVGPVAARGVRGVPEVDQGMLRGKA